MTDQTPDERRFRLAGQQPARQPLPQARQPLGRAGDGDPVVVQFGGWSAMLKVGLGAVFCLGLGGSAVVASIVGSFDSTGARIAGAVIGGLFFLLGMGLALSLKAVRRDRSLVVSAKGVTWDDPQGRAWSASWPELSRVSIVQAYRQTRNGKKFRVRLLVTPVDIDRFAARRPQMSVLRGQYGAGPNEYGLPLATAVKKVPAIAEGLQRFGGPANGGFVDEGRVTGMGYV